MRAAHAPEHWRVASERWRHRQHTNCKPSIFMSRTVVMCVTHTHKHSRLALDGEAQRERPVSPPSPAQGAERSLTGSFAGTALLRSAALAPSRRAMEFPATPFSAAARTIPATFAGCVGGSFAARSYLALRQDDGSHARARRGLATRRCCARPAFRGYRWLQGTTTARDHLLLRPTPFTPAQKCHNDGRRS